MVKKAVTVIALVGLLAGCAHAPYTVEAPFNPESVSWSQTPGTDTLKGQAFLRTVDGHVKTCAGYPVILVPYNRYFAEVTRAYVRGYSALTNKDPRAHGYARETRCDADGKFSFSNLPSGEWLVVAEVRWGIPDGDFVLPQGGVVYATETTSRASSEEVILTR